MAAAVQGTADLPRPAGTLIKRYPADILDCMEESRPNIRNIRGYLLTALYRAPETMEGYYAAKVVYDEGGFYSRKAA